MGWPFHTFELGNDKNFSNIYSVWMQDTGKRSEPEKSFNNKVNTTVGPLKILSPLGASQTQC